MKQNIIEIYDQNNELKKIKVFKFFTLKDNNKDYIIYSDYDNKYVKYPVFAAEVIEKDDSFELKEIEEKEIIEKMKSIMEGLNNE